MNIPVDADALVESSPLAAVGGGRPRVPLADYQEEARDTLSAVALDTFSKIRSAPDRRRDIALAQGVMLLCAPTGSGKTLTASRTIERIVGSTLRPTVWFWWTPFSGLVEQTRSAFEAHSPTLRVRDLATDRIPADTKDGDVSMATWASVSSRSRTLNARKSSEDAPSVDLLLEWLRVEGWNVGAVIDEAHVNFGMSATEAAAFYLEVLKPDVTMLCTATPRDEELMRFCRAAGIGAVNRVEIARDRVVDAGLNKVGVKAVRLQATPEDKDIVDLGEAALAEGLARHRILKAELAAQGVSLVPLMLVQVENSKTNESVDRAHDFLVREGVPTEAIAKHTTGDPDPYFHTLAYDESREVLIFKVSAATGFDAPRAWTLVSLRQTMDRQFGLQVLGRIVRVHPRVRHLHPRLSGRTEPSILDYGYAFLATPEQQPGLVEAAARMKAFHDEVSTITDHVVVYSSMAGAVALVRPEDGFADLLAPGGATAAADDRDEVGLQSPATGPRTLADHPHSALQRALDLGIRTGSASISASPANFVLRPTVAAGTSSKPKPAHVYPLRSDVSFPRTFAREVMPEKVDALVGCIGRRFAFDAEALALVNRTFGRVQITEEDLFATVREQERRQADVPLSAEKIAAHAQMSFRFNDYLDDRELREILKERLKKELLDRRWQKVDERELRRAVDLIVMARPDLLHDACRACLAEHSVILQDEPIPTAIEDEDVLEPALRNLYGVFPKGLNKEELAFARRIDEEETGTVVWWTRNVSMARWAVSIVRPNGRLHYPDFVIGVDARRKTDDGIALVEIKDDGSDGRLFSEGNTEKVRTEHRRYGTALMLFRDGRGRWTQAVYRPDLGHLIHGNRFVIEDLIHVRG